MSGRGELGSAQSEPHQNAEGLVSPRTNASANASTNHHVHEEDERFARLEERLEARVRDMEEAHDALVSGLVERIKRQQARIEALETVNRESDVDARLRAHDTRFGACDARIGAAMAGQGLGRALEGERRVIEAMLDKQTETVNETVRAAAQLVQEQRERTDAVETQQRAIDERLASLAARKAKKRKRNKGAEPDDGGASEEELAAEASPGSDAPPASPKAQALKAGDPTSGERPPRKRSLPASHGLSEQQLAALAAAGQEPPPSNMYMLRGLLMLFSVVPIGLVRWACLGLDDSRLDSVGSAMVPLSVLLLLCHWFVTMELTKDLGRLELFHLVVYWLAALLPHFLFTLWGSAGVGGSYTGAVGRAVAMCTIFTYPVYAMGNKIRKAVRAHQLSLGTLGSFVGDFCAQVIPFYGIPVLYLTMGSISALLKLDPWAIGSEPGADLDDEEGEAEAAEAAWGVAYSIFAADWSFSMLALMLAICELALFGTGLSDVRALVTFRVPHYQRIAGMGLLLAGVVALYAQATKGEGADEVWGVMRPLFGLGVLVFLLALGCGLPLKKVLNGDQIAPG